LQRDKRAVTTIEYALVAALVAVTIINSVFQVGHSIQNTFSRISSEL
jgi:pilus assembly protein Flp/PilA